jgi:hypothetical protein
MNKKTIDELEAELLRCSNGNPYRVKQKCSRTSVGTLVRDGFLPLYEPMLPGRPMPT